MRVGKEKSYQQDGENRCQGEYSTGAVGLHRHDLCLMSDVCHHDRKMQALNKTVLASPYIIFLLSTSDRKQK